MNTFWALLYLTSFTIAYCDVMRFDNYRVFGVTPKTAADLEALHQLKNDVIPWHDLHIGVTGQLMVAPQQVESFERAMASLHLNTTLLWANVQE